MGFQKKVSIISEFDTRYKHTIGVDILYVVVLGL